jgi:type II secretory pathway pseudopilin PulG
MRRESLLAAALLGLLPGLALADLSRARAEQNLERRARLAWENAALQVKAASKSYGSGDWAETIRALEEVRDSLELARQSLEAAVRNPRNSRSYKNFEVRTREVLKHLGALHERMSFEERRQIEPLIENIRKIHDDALWAVMGGRPAEKPR